MRRNVTGRSFRLNHCQTHNSNVANDTTLAKSKDKSQNLSEKAGKQKSKLTLLADKIDTSRPLQVLLQEFVPREQVANKFWGTVKFRTQVNAITSMEQISTAQISSEGRISERVSSILNETFLSAEN